MTEAGNRSSSEACGAERYFVHIPRKFGPCVKPQGHREYHKERAGWQWLSSRQERERMKAARNG